MNKVSGAPLKVCFFGIYEPSYSRNDVLINGLRQNDVEVVQCCEDYKSRGRYLRLLKKLKAVRDSCDVIYTAYPAPVPTILAKLFSRKPVIMDAFYSMYDAVVHDRKEIPWYHPRAIRLLILDWVALLMADAIVVDTEEHKKYWSSWFYARASKIHVVYIGVNHVHFHPQNSAMLDPVAQDAQKSALESGSDSPVKKFLVHFHGKYIPLQGIPVIVEAARRLRDDHSIRFRFVGSGAESAKVEHLIETYGLTNIERIGRVSLTELNAYMSEADIILGIFGKTPKSKRVIPNKVFEGLAAQKPLISTGTPAMREVFNDEDLVLIDNDPKALAHAIIELKKDPAKRLRLATHGYQTVMRDFLPKSIGADLKAVCLSLAKPLE